MESLGNSESPELRRSIGPLHATAMVVGTIIGASIFVQPSEVTRQMSSIKGVFLIWFVAGLLTFFGALVCAELASIFSRSGGIYVYLKEAYSPAIGFLWGWAMFWSAHSGVIAAISVIFSRYVSFFLLLNAAMSKAVSVAVILILSAINYRGVQQGSSLQALITLGKIIAVVFIILFGFALGSRIPEHFVTARVGHDVSLNGFLLALAAGLFAFGGWHMVTYNSEETIDPRKTIPKALMIGTLVVTLCYMALNAVYLYILPLESVASSTRIAADAADAILGFGGGALMSGLVIFSTFGALSGIILCGPRVYYSMARDGLLFRWLGDVHPRYQTPHKAIFIQAVWSSTLVVTGTYKALFTRVVNTEWAFFAMVAFGLFLLRRKTGVVRGYRIWGYPFVPGLFLVASLVVVANQMISDLKESLFGFLFVLFGLPIYHYWSRKAKQNSGT